MNDELPEIIAPEATPIFAEDAGEPVIYAPGTAVDPELIEEEYIHAN